MEVGVRWNQLPWIPKYSEMNEVSCSEGTYVLRELQAQPTKFKNFSDDIRSKWHRREQNKTEI
jgi:hypothetical protein